MPHPCYRCFLKPHICTARPAAAAGLQAAACRAAEPLDSAGGPLSLRHLHVGPRRDPGGAGAAAGALGPQAAGAVRPEPVPPGVPSDPGGGRPVGALCLPHPRGWARRCWIACQSRKERKLVGSLQERHLLLSMCLCGVGVVREPALAAPMVCGPGWPSVPRATPCCSLCARALTPPPAPRSARQWRVCPAPPPGALCLAPPGD